MKCAELSRAQIAIDLLALLRSPRRRAATLFHINKKSAHVAGTKFGNWRSGRSAFGSAKTFGLRDREQGRFHLHIVPIFCGGAARLSVRPETTGRSCRFV